MTIVRIIVKGLAWLLAGGALGGLAGYGLALAYMKWWAAPGAEPAGVGMAAFLILSLGIFLGAAAGLALFVLSLSR